MNTFFLSPESCPRHTIFPGVTISTWWGDRLMMSLVEMTPRAVVEEHRHPHEQIGIVLEGQALFLIGGVEKVLKAGDRFRIPSNVPHKVINFDQNFRALDAFNPPRDEYK